MLVNVGSKHTKISLSIILTFQRSLRTFVNNKHKALELNVISYTITLSKNIFLSIK